MSDWAGCTLLLSDSLHKISGACSLAGRLTLLNCLSGCIFINLHRVVKLVFLIFDVREGITRLLSVWVVVSVVTSTTILVSSRLAGCVAS